MAYRDDFDGAREAPRGAVLAACVVHHAHPLHTIIISGGRHSIIIIAGCMHSIVVVVRRARTLREASHHHERHHSLNHPFRRPCHAHNHHARRLLQNEQWQETPFEELWVES